MEENTNLTEQQEANQPDAFLAGWDDELDTVTAADPQDEAGESSTETEETDGNTEPTGGDGASESAENTSGSAEATAEGAGAEGAQEAGGASAEPSWIIKHMGSETKLTAKDITPELLQKGRDYDRIRGKYDEAKPLIELFSAEAAKRGISVLDYAKLLRTESKKAEGLTEDEARRAVELEDREAAVAAKEATAAENAKAEEASAARIRAELEEFARVFPEVYNKAASDPKSLPQSVYDDWKSGISLCAAYAKYTVAAAAAQAKQAAERVETNEKNTRNAERATGSMKSAGSDTHSQDPFLEGFDD